LAQRLGNKLELLLAESLRLAHDSGAVRTQDLARVTVDTTVQLKNITLPTDAKLVHAAIRGLNRLARQHSVSLRQSYLRIAKRAVLMAGRYAHAKEFNRYRRELRLLRSRLAASFATSHATSFRARAYFSHDFRAPLARSHSART
jgi:IS5 family transposase